MSYILVFILSLKFGARLTLAWSTRLKYFAAAGVRAGQPASTLPVRQLPRDSRCDGRLGSFSFSISVGFYVF